MKKGTVAVTGTGTEKVRLNCEVEVAKQAVKEAKETVLVAIRASQKPYDKIWLNLEVEKLDYTALCGLWQDVTTKHLSNEAISYTVLCGLWQDACKADADCIAASKAIEEAYKVQHAADEVLKEVLCRYSGVSH